MPAYGLGWWPNAEVDAAQAAEVPAKGIGGGRHVFWPAPADLVAAAGANDNRLYVVPSADLVIVRLGDGHAGWRDGEFLAAIYGE
ncbi:MAG: hypothetical protein ACOZNI_25660 [Myxococcota bacterium]